MPEVTFKTITQISFTLNLEDSQTIADVKKKIAEDKGEDYAVDLQKLIYNGKILDDATTVGEIAIDPKKFVVVMLGRKKAPPAAEAPPATPSPAVPATPKQSEPVPETPTVAAQVPNPAAPEISSVRRAFNTLSANDWNPDRAVDLLIGGFHDIPLDNLNIEEGQGGEEAGGIEYLANLPQMNELHELLAKNPALLPEFMKQTPGNRFRKLLYAGRMLIRSEKLLHGIGCFQSAVKLMHTVSVDDYIRFDTSFVLASCLYKLHYMQSENIVSQREIIEQIECNVQDSISICEKYESAEWLLKTAWSYELWANVDYNEYIFDQALDHFTSAAEAFKVTGPQFKQDMDRNFAMAGKCEQRLRGNTPSQYEPNFKRRRIMPEVTFKTITQISFTLNLEDSQTIADVKKKIAEDKGEDYAVDLQKLIYNGKILDDATTVGEIAIDPKKFVVVMLGRKKAPPAAEAPPATPSPAVPATPKQSEPVPETPTVAAQVPNPAAPEISSVRTAEQVAMVDSIAAMGYENVIELTQEEAAAIQRIKSMGFRVPDGLILEAYLACDKNEEMAIDYILNRMGEDDFQ